MLTATADHLRLQLAEPLNESSHHHSPLPLSVAVDVRNLATSSARFLRSFAKLPQNSPASRKFRMQVKVLRVCLSTGERGLQIRK